MKDNHDALWLELYFQAQDDMPDARSPAVWKCMATKTRNSLKIYGAVSFVNLLMMPYADLLHMASDDRLPKAQKKLFLRMLLTDLEAYKRFTERTGSVTAVPDLLPKIDKLQELLDLYEQKGERR